MSAEATPKSEVRAFWEAGSCGEVYADGEDLKSQMESQARVRYELEPYIHPFAEFSALAPGRDVLEIGVGMGADHCEWAKAGPKSLRGVDLTDRAVEWTTRRLETFGFTPDVRQGDAENLPFEDESFDLVYSWGVIMCSPDTPRAVREIHRVLRPGGRAKVMIYHRYSLTGYMLWLRYALLARKPGRSLNDVYETHLESPGTKAYSVDETAEMFSMFEKTDIHTILNFGDLLEGEVGQQHRGPILSIAKALWPRWLLRHVAKNHGLYVMIDAHKAA